MSITDWPEGDRPRERLLAQGAESLSDAELLAIYLRVGVAGLSAVDLAREMLTHFGGLHGLLTANQAEFCDIRGIGPAKYTQIQASLELTKRFLKTELDRPNVMNSPKTVQKYLASRLQDKQEERFLLLLLDTQHRVIGDNELSRGTIAAANVYPREVVKAVLAKNAAAVILAHNHPSGVAEPSQADRDITSRIQQALSLIDVSVLDHIVIGAGQSCSFAERGWL